MKVAIHQFSTLALGDDTFIFDVASSLVKRGHEVQVITSNQLPLIGGKRNLTMKEMLQRLGGASLREYAYFKIFPSVNSLVEIKNLLRKCDVLYVKNEVFDLFPIDAIKTKLNIPTVCGIHTYILPLTQPNSSIRLTIRNIVYKSAFYRHLLHRCEAFHVLNRFDLRLLLSYGIDVSRMFLIPLGVDTGKFKPKVRENNDFFKILFIGRLDKSKGFDTLFFAISNLRSTKVFKRTVFTIIGDGKMRQLAIKLSQVYPNVKYLSFLPQNLLVDLYNSHDVLVLPSRAETFSYTCLEAQSCGIPVISTTIPGPMDIIEHEKTGLLVAPGNWKDLSEAMLRMYKLKESGAINTMKKLSRANVLKKHSVEAMADKVEFLLNRTINRS